MAAEVPISDVLCEAMEYLSKLGSNLRSRSENLKDKRIRKDKLKNTRAVQKAANKVLLICELSKKSLDNVETGVRKVLSLIDASQEPLGGKCIKSDELQNNYHYFEYRSRKLRIANKITLKHYMSAEVVVHRMPTSVQEKYPVYYDCKLKRQRRRCEKRENLMLEIKRKKLHIASDRDSDDMRSNSGDGKQLDNELHKEIYGRLSDSEHTQPLMDTDTKKLNNECDGNINSERCVSPNKEDECSIMEVCDDETLGKTNKEILNKRVRFSDIYSDSNDDTQQKTPIEKLDNTKISTNSSIELEPEIKKINESEMDKDVNTQNCGQINNETDKTSKSDDNCLITKNSVDDQLSDTCSESVRPQIRCVNLSKLLKPNALINENLSNNNVEGTKLSYKTNALSKNEISKKKSQKIIKKLLSHDDRYWAEKRKEVAEFKAKLFSINVEILPNLTESYLLVHKLSRVIKNGFVICEITREEDTLNSNNIKEVKNALLNDSESDESIATLEANKLKKSLLKDSDSENNTSDKAGKQSVSSETNDNDKNMDIDTIINSLLNESDPENNGEQDLAKESGSVDTQIESTKLCETVNGPGISVINNGSDKIKEHENNSHDKESEEKKIQDQETPTKSYHFSPCLLNDSSVEKLDKNSEETPSKTNAKLKSALLNDSSPEEGENVNNTEQETPRKINAKVKKSLLNDSSDEKCNEVGEDTPNKASAKASLLNDSSDIQSDTNDVTEKKRKTPKSKRKYIQKCRESKRKLYYSSSSDDNKQEKHRHKRSRLKSHTSSSSSSEDIKKKINKKRIIDDSDSNNSDNASKKSIEQVDGADNNQSDSNIDKMVRSKAKPSGSSSQISDNQDSSDKDIDRLTNLNNLNKNRRDTSLKKSNNADSERKSQKKSTPILGGDLLKAEPSSESASEGENEVDEELPPVSSLGLNGDVAVDHMAKDDLLEDSDSSGSLEKEESENANDIEDTDEDTNVKSRRRKPLAISSDSDGGSNRRKKGDEKMSDFEDSEDESSEPANKSKRKKKISDSDASVDSNEGGQKKRRRIKQVRDSDASGSDTENEGRNKHGRKNIRKVMGKNQLEEATKKAAREEKERIARISERQKIYNNLDFDESGKPDEVVLDKVVLDFDPETKEPLIQLDRGLVKKLKPHQANGIKFMWDACFESVKRIKKDKGSGCILAHCMGLGKTLQVISLTHTLLTHGSLTGVNRVLVVCPLSTVLNWVNEFNMWLKHAEAKFDVDVYELSRHKQNSERAYQLQQWFEGGGVCVLGYEMFRNLSADNPKKFKKKMLKSFQQSLVDPGPDLVVCDEGHLLKNEKTSLSQSMNRVKTLRRIVLTGTPLQNNLKEYYCMVQFVKPNLLGKYSEYLNRFVNPITNGQYTDSTEHDIRIMKRRSHVLHKMLDGAVQRRDYGVLAPFLPPKHEYVLFITLTDVQIKLYQHYLDNYSRRPMSGRTGFLFPDFQSLQRIWTHPLVLKYNSERYEILQQKKREREEEEESDGSQGSLAEFIDDDSTSEATSTEESTDDSSDASDDSRKKSKKKKSAKKKDSKVSTRRGTRANPVMVEDVVKSEDVVEIKNDNPTEWWIKLVDDSELDDMRNSHKLILLFDILRQCENIGDKLLVFSQSLYSLDLIEHFLGKVDEATQEGRIDEKLGGHVGSWSPGIDYFRLDGSTSCENRSIWCKNFNREDNPRARLFLISTRAGGLGINLVAANRVVIFDVSWNPSHDVQSIFRVYRFGQKKPCYVYRFLAMGTMEEKIYERQVTKQAISKRVIDEQQIDRHYAENDLAELYKFEARPEEPRPLPTLPKDRLFAEMLKEHEAQIYKYHEHDSLLENKEEETLSEEERKAAWEDFENEKTRPPPAPFPAPWPMHNGMVPGLFAQQQQMAFVALASALRNEMPNMNDNQIRERLSLLLNSPSVMQKVNEAYKYMPGMMNPGMMNAMPAAGSGGGGTSGLQYEPPWQRQQQQQQQMRLQQLMQHQNPMGAKYYAGGLGSRDPVAMALQQQRAREFMMGGGGGGTGAGTGSRPRGRPPMQPRVPTATSQDIVNLDSD